MKAMFDLITSMPMLVLVSLGLLMRRKARPLTQVEISRRLDAIQAFTDLLPRAEGECQKRHFSAVMSWCVREIEALSVLERLNLVMVGTVPVVHDPRITRSN